MHSLCEGAMADPCCVFISPPSRSNDLEGAAPLFLFHHLIFPSFLFTYSHFIYVLDF